VAYEWGRFIWWLGQNAAAIQALAAIVVVLLTVALVFVTGRYVRLTREMSQTMRQQLAAAFQPNIGIMFAQPLRSESWNNGVASDGIADTLQIQNRSASPLKLHSVHISISFGDSRYQRCDKDFPFEDIVISPDYIKQIHFDITVPHTASQNRFYKLALVVCSDLADVNEHWFIKVDKGEISHHQFSKLTNRKADLKRFSTELDKLRQIYFTRLIEDQQFPEFTPPASGP